MRSILKWTAIASWPALASLWLLYVAQRPAPVPLARAVAVLAFVATLGLLGERAAAMWRRGARARLAALASLVALALALYLPGIGHEVGDNYYHDEGAYRSNANAINKGQFLRQAFNYPHLLYYADAFATWVASLFHPAVLGWSDALYGISDWSVFCRLLARLLTALAGALTVVPVFLLAERLAGLGAGVVAGILIVAASQYHEGSNLHTCDIPSAFFAMVCLAAVGRLLRWERARDYLLAGVWAGLAAGSKYPAGVVAVAIVAVWVRGRLRQHRGVAPDEDRRAVPPEGDRRHAWGLPLAGLSALATFLLTTPSLVVFHEFSIFGGKGALFGWRQYTQGRWIGVVADSNLAYYLELTVASFGWLAIAAGLAGLLLLGRRPRADVLWLLPFPLLYLALMMAMSLVVERNLYPALPPLATLLGAGIWTLGRRLAAFAPRHPRAAPWAAAALVAASVALPLGRVTLQEIALCRDSTRQLASAWIHQHLPRGSRILKERYTPNIHRGWYEVGTTRWIGSYSVEELRGYDLDYVVLSHAAYQRFLDPARHFKPDQAIVERNYRDIFERLELAASYEPGPLRRGPVIKIYRVPDQAEASPASKPPAKTSMADKTGTACGILLELRSSAAVCTPT